ncbi:Jacalin-type lectin domain-containing protein [Abortiporus biennis]
MNPATFPYTEDDLNRVGVLDEGVSGYAKQAVQTMKDHPDLLTPSLFGLECIVLQGQHYRGPGSTTFSDSSITSASSVLTVASESTVGSEHGPDAYERVAYYNGITGDSDHPELIYRSDALTTPFPKPAGRFAHVPVKSLRGVFDTPLNKVWDFVGPQIRDIIKAREIQWSSIDTARFFTHAAPGEEKEKGSLGPVVIWIGVKPGSTSSDTAHHISQEILTLLGKNKVDDVVVEWREAVLQKLSGPPLMRHADSTDATHHVRRFLTALLAVPLTTQEMEEDDSQGTLTLWMHENKDNHGNPSDKVFGISNCHVLRKNTKVKYEHKAGAAKDHVRVCGMRRFQRGLNEITKAAADNLVFADLHARDIVRLQAKGDQAKNEKKIARIQSQLEERNEAVADLQKLHDDVARYWSDIKFSRNIGHVVYAPAIKVDHGRTEYTADWGAFLAAKPKVKDSFVGNVVDLGSKYSPPELMDMFYPGSGPSTFKYPEERMLRIFGCATKEELAVPAEFDSEGQRCLMVGKDGNTTDLTVGRFSGIESFTNSDGVESMEVAIYNSGNKSVEVFSAKGDSGSLVWHINDGMARIVGQIHSGDNKGGSTSNHVTYCTPGWYLLAEIKKKYKHADFYRTTW